MIKILITDMALELYEREDSECRYVYCPPRRVNRLKGLHDAEMEIVLPEHLSTEYIQSVLRELCTSQGAKLIVR